jgi:hypothetical protein
MASDGSSPQSAEAYCGAAHGACWPVADDAALPDTVELPAGGHSTAYRLVRNPMTGQPSRNSKGRYVYLPDSAAPLVFAAPSRWLVTTAGPGRSAS